MLQLSMGFECRFFLMSPAEDGILGREEREIIAEGTAKEFRHDCVSSEKGGFAERRHTSGKA